MLRGHETLVRLVGKRRRLDPASSSCLEKAESQDINTSILNNTREGEQILALRPSGEAASEDNLQPPITSRNGNFFQWVQCPVCSRGIRADDRSLNIHLDLCLLGTVACKNDQLTLSQLGNVACSSTSLESERMGSKKGRKIILRQSTMVESMAAVISSSAASQSKLISESHGIYKLGSPCPSEDPLQKMERQNGYKGGKDPKVRDDAALAELSRNGLEVTMHKECVCSCHLGFDASLPVHVNEKIISASCSSNSEGNETGDATARPRDSSVAEVLILDRDSSVTEVLILETLIVGRKFNRLVKVEENMEVKAIREADNPKDSNAIKIVAMDSQGGVTVGHLPREVASHLSCLLDKEFLTIQGVVQKIPEKLYGPVPIKLVCEKRCLKEREDAEFFNNAWQKVLQVLNENGTDKLSNPSQIKYLHNFLYFMRAVLDRDSHIFSEDELAFLGSFFSLNETAQCLFIRLFQRKGPWFQVSQISYSEIPDPKQAADELLAAGFVDVGSNLEKEASLDQALRERLQVLTVPELKQILSMGRYKGHKLDSGVSRREDLLDWIVSVAKEKQQSSFVGSCSGESMTSLILQAVGFCIRISDKASFLVWRLQRLFFLNGEQDVSAFLLVDMGAIKYPVYKCSQTRKVFTAREALLAYEQALEVAQAMDMALESNDQHTILNCVDTACIQLEISSTCLVDSESEDAFLARFTPGWVYATVLTLGVSVLERERRYVEAVGVLKKLLSQSCCPGRRGIWTVRLSMDLEHLGRKEESLQTAEAGLNDPRIRTGDRVALQRRALRLAKPPRRWKKPAYADAFTNSFKEISIRGRPLNNKPGVKSRFYGFDGEQCSVEELALQYYAGESGGGWQGVHSESGIWMTLFALLMWDVLFADIPNVFWHPFQASPFDLNTDAFYPRREALIEEQLSRISSGDSSHILTENWAKWFGTVCTGMNWERQSLEELKVIAACVGGPGLASICRLLAEDHAGWGGGMPDLLLWRPLISLTNCSQCSCYNGGDAKLVEVKGPRDRLSEQQLAWIHILMQAGISVEVCKVLEEPKSQDS